MKKFKTRQKNSKFHVNVFGEIVTETFYTNKITIKYLKSIKNLGKHTVIINNL